MKGTLYLVNRAHPLPEEPAAEDLASVRSGQTEVRLHQRAKVMLDQLLAAAKYQIEEVLSDCPFFDTFQSKGRKKPIRRS